MRQRIRSRRRKNSSKVFLAGVGTGGDDRGVGCVGAW